ncbi:MAG: tetratricopeptide repeat protein [Phormidesmis sp.]
MSNVSAFVGREDDLARVDALLQENSRVNIAAAVGMGGVGKTELALQYALRRGDAFPGGVCWLRGVEPIAPQMVSFAQDYLGLEVPEQTENPVAWYCNRWPGAGEANDAVLMVVDDVQDYGALKAMLPSPATGGGRFRVLLTTRQGILPSHQRLALEVLLPGAALELLTGLVSERRIGAETEAAEALCERVGRLPLGIELVGWHLARRPELTVAKLLERLERKKLAARALMKAHPEMTAKLGVAAAFEVSWEPLTDEAKTLAGLLGLFAAAPIDWAWVGQAMELTRYEQAGEVLDEEDLEEGQKELLDVNLLQIRDLQGARRYQVHPLVREFFVVKLGALPAAAALQQGFAQVMTDVAKGIPQAVTVAVRAKVTEAVPHMEEVAARWSVVLEGVDKIWCCTGLGRFYESLSQWADAERCWQRSLEIRKTELGDRHPDTASSVNNLAALYESQGRYGEAEPLYVQALEIRKTELGDRHPDTAASLNNLAALYESQGRYGEAEPLYVQALEIRKTELGDRHPDTAASLNNLAELYRSQGRYGEAEPLYVQALEIRKTELGDRHPDTASSLNNLAVLYAYTNRFSQAIEIMSQVISIHESQLGPEHPDTLSSKQSLKAMQQAMKEST